MMPNGWRVTAESDYSEPGEVYTRYVAFYWTTWTERRLFRKPITHRGWRYMYHSRSHAEVKRWVRDTAPLM
jgi:hypothetical protein